MPLLPILRRNVDLGPPLKMSGWRKIAIGTWRNIGDPSVYGMLDIDARPAQEYLESLRAQTGKRITLTHFVGKAVGIALGRHPEINCLLRWGRLYPRRKVDIFFQVATDSSGDDLGGTVIRDANHKSLPEISDEMEARIERLRVHKNDEYGGGKQTARALPGMLSGWILEGLGFLLYTLNIWTPLVGAPRDPFGSAMVTNIGPLGIDTAFGPLVPYSRVPLLLAVGAVHDAPWVRDGKLEVAPVIRICVTFDHRFIDGVHASKMSKTLKAIFADPKKELGSHG